MSKVTQRTGEFHEVAGSKTQNTKGVVVAEKEALA